MNSEQAKKISLPDLMARLGYQPTRILKGGTEYWFLSPFRSEAEASFHTSFLGGKWIWKDFGDIGGTVIDFVMRHENYTKVHEALSFLDKFYQNKPYKNNKKQVVLFSFQQQEALENSAEPTLQLEQTTPLHYTLTYLTETRKIDPAIANQYLVEVHFMNKENGKSYFAAGIQNRAGGFEIRNQYFKSCVGKKDLTFIKGEKPGTDVLIFEGFIDFLSYLTDRNILKPDQDTLILNSVSFGQEALAFIKNTSYIKILTFFDNDKAGKNLQEIFRQELEQEKVYPMNFLYEDFRDYNEKLALKK